MLRVIIYKDNVKGIPFDCCFDLKCFELANLSTDKLRERSVV